MPDQRALLSVSNKSGLVELAGALASFGIRLLASGGTAKLLRSEGFAVQDVQNVTQSPEILGGRVKTLHPAIHGGILARDIESDEADLASQQIEKIDLVVCNLYLFEQTISAKETSIEEAIEQIDVGGVALLRAGAKNFQRVVVLPDPLHYSEFIRELISCQGILSSLPLSSRQRLAVEAFRLTSHYDSIIASYLESKFDIKKPESQSLTLRYGINPHQQPARVVAPPGSKGLPFKVLSGKPGYINLLDSLNGWFLVKELQKALGVPAAASFKHVSPAGAAIAGELGSIERRVYMVDDLVLTPIASAYARARGADRMSSFGDWIALSEECDIATATLISREVSDGIVAPGYKQEALEVLSKKKAGKYVVLQMDPEYEPADQEIRQVCGVQLEQKHNSVQIDAAFFNNVVTSKNKLPKEACRDLILGCITLKYTQSNSICFAKNGMVVGLGAGQQSRIHCTRLAASKVDNWWLRHHPTILGMKFKAGTKRADKANAIDLFVSGELYENSVGQERRQWAELYEQVPEALTKEERAEHLESLSGVSVSSDAFFPFPDNIHRAFKSGAQFVAAPGGSIKDDVVIAAANSYNMVMCHTPCRLFHH